MAPGFSSGSINLNGTLILSFPLSGENSCYSWSHSAGQMHSPWWNEYKQTNTLVSSCRTHTALLITMKWKTLLLLLKSLLRTDSPQSLSYCRFSFFSIALYNCECSLVLSDRNLLPRSCCSKHYTCLKNAIRNCTIRMKQWKLQQRKISSNMISSEFFVIRLQMAKTPN